jgi:DNA polymerase-3 subunit delta'
MSLKDICCQDKAIGILQRALAADRAAHAYIFAGPGGVGKSTTAREWAKLLLCENPRRQGSTGKPFADSCGTCGSCALCEADSHPDYARVYKELREFTKDGKDKPPPVDLPIDVIREFLIDKAAIRPGHSKRKVFVVSEAERLNAYSQNALLKVLEEPPHYCTIILLCTRLERLLPTTRSRCQIIRFGPVDTERIVADLRAGGLSNEQAGFFARLAQGSLGQARQWARLEHDGLGLFEIKRRMIASLAELTLSETLTTAEQFLEDAKQIAAAWVKLAENVSKKDINRRAQKTVIQVLISALRDVLTHHIRPNRLFVNADQRDPIVKLSRRFDAEQAAQGIHDGYEALRWMEANVNERLIFERLLFGLTPSAIMAPR